MPFKPHLKVGSVFGRLTIIEVLTKTTPKNPHIRYLCRCSCGGQTTTSRYKLTSGDTVGCGCYRNEINSREPGTVSFNMLYKRMLDGAKKRHYVVELTKEEHKQIIVQNCFYCGIEPSPYNPYVRVRDGIVYQIKVTQKYLDRAWINANGVDRVDSSIGYTLSNCVSCCFECNYMKNVFTQEHFLAHIKRINDFQNEMAKRL